MSYLEIFDEDDLDWVELDEGDDLLSDVVVDHDDLSELGSAASSQLRVRLHSETSPDSSA